MYKLLALDIDDTLTNMARAVPTSNIEAINRAQAAGVFVTVATGRGYHGSSHIWKQLNIHGPVINYGGAIVMDSNTDTMLYSTAVTPELVIEALEFAHELGVHSQLYQGDGIVCENENAYAQKYVSFLDLKMDIDPDIRKKSWNNVPKVLYITDAENAERLMPIIAKRFEDRLKVSASKPGFIEINHKDAHKGSAVAWVAQYMGIPQEQVVAIGDNTLDSEMIKWAGLGVAVGNAYQSVKDIADIIAPDCADNAVAWVIDNVILKGC
ncbi:MAG: Cof-type HAD-IIB family hydrolase [Clostridia bacterium]